MERLRLLLDTSILIDYFRKTDKKNTHLVIFQKNYNFAVSVVTEYEFMVGFKQNSKVQFTDFFSSFEILDFDRNTVDCAVKIYQDLKNSNQIIPSADIFIAATAVAHDIPLATLNTKHFERIKDLELV